MLCANVVFHPEHIEGSEPMLGFDARNAAYCAFVTSVASMQKVPTGTDAGPASPLHFVVLASLQSGSSFFSGTLTPRHLTLTHYASLFSDTEFLTWVKNSMIVCTTVSILSTVCVALLAYAFARLKFYGQRHGLFALWVIQLFPATIAVPAYFYFLLKLSEWSNNHIGLETYGGLILLLTGVGMAFYAWLFKGYLDNLPIELEEAAFVDGATRFQVMWYVIAPLVRPMIATVFQLVFIAT